MGIFLVRISFQIHHSFRNILIPYFRPDQIYSAANGCLRLPDLVSTAELRNAPAVYVEDFDNRILRRGDAASGIEGIGVGGKRESSGCVISAIDVKSCQIP